MQVLLTGGTGFVGAEVLKALRAAGHDVTAIVRSEASAAAVTEHGATAVQGDVTDHDWLSEQLRGVDGAIHTASPGDETSAAFDTAVAKAVANVFAGTDKPYVHTGGIWVHGTGADITEDTPRDAPAITAWREDVEKIVLETEGLHGIVVAPAVVYGNGGGIPNLLANGPRNDEGELLLLGDGSQHWSTVHADDLADLYVRALEQAEVGGYWLGASGQNPTVREIVEAIAGDAGVAESTVEEAHARLGEYFADALLVSQQASGAKAKAELGWNPTAPSLLEELANGSYVAVPTVTA